MRRLLTLVKEQRVHIALLIIILLSFGVRQWKIDSPALWEDDYLNLDHSQMPVSGIWDFKKWEGPVDTLHDFQPPLSFILLHYTLDISKTSFAARELNLLAGMLAILGVFALGRRLFGPGPGLLAAALLSLSLFHIEYSRSIKAYGLFFCFSVWSTFFVHRAVTQSRLRNWLGWILTATGALYSAYIGLPAIAGQCLWAGGMILWGLLKRTPGARREAALFGSSAGAVGFFYLPWVPAVLFIQNMLSDPGADPIRRMTWKWAQDVLAGFFLYTFPAQGWLIPAVLILMAAGVAWAVRSGKGKELSLLLFWVLAPAVAVCLSKSIMNQIVSSRHLFNFLALVTLLPAAGAWCLGSLLRMGKSVAFIAGLTLCILLTWPQMELLPDLYSRSISLDRDYFYWLWATAQSGNSVKLEGWKRKPATFCSRWFLSGLYDSPGDFTKPGIDKLLFIENQFSQNISLSIPFESLISQYKYGPFSTSTKRIVLISRSPLHIIPDSQGRYAYDDDFTSLKMLTDAYSSSNMAPDLTLASLAPIRTSLPGQATYCFKFSDGVAPDTVRLTLTPELYKRAAKYPSDSRFEVLAGPSQDAMKLVGTVAWDNFLDKDGRPRLEKCPAYEEGPMYQSCARATASMDLPRPTGGELWVEIRYLPGVSEGYLLLKHLRLEVETKGAPADAQGEMPWQLVNLLKNGGCKRWESGDVNPGGLFAFAARGDLGFASPRLGSLDDLSAFQAEHPGLEPVHVFRAESGDPQVLFFDPALRLRKASPEAIILKDGTSPARGIVLSGLMKHPKFKIGSGGYEIPVNAPAGSVLMLNPGSRGKLVWTPDFSKAHFAKLEVDGLETVRPAPDGDNDGGLTCRAEGPCRFSARLDSALRIDRIRLEWYPRVVADPTGKNSVTLSYSTDEGRTFKVIEKFVGNGTGKWTSLFTKHVKTLNFPEPIQHFMIKAELTGEDAQLWSHERPVDRMWIEADLDARSVKQPELPDGKYRIDLLNPDNNDFTMRIYDKPYPLFDSIKYWQ